MVLRASVQRPQFRLELDMTAPVYAWLRRNQLNVKREFALPWGICDLVGVSFNERRAQLRLTHGQVHSVGTPRRVSLLYKIPDVKSRRAITLRQLRSEFSGILSNDALEHELHYLIRCNFVRVPKNGFFQSLNGWAPLHDRIVAVELKLSRIHEAFEQACSNRAFASESYVALPSRTARRLIRTGRADLFRKSGVGILAVGARSCLPVLPSTYARKQQDLLLQAHCVERFWRSRGSCS
jgi:hypothetical protein